MKFMHLFCRQRMQFVRWAISSFLGTVFFGSYHAAAYEVPYFENDQTNGIQQQTSIIQSRKITGRVSCQNGGTGLPGVVVTEKASFNFAVTNHNGEYSIEVAEGALLVFALEGYVSEEINVGDRSVIDISMKTDVWISGGNIAVGYGTQTKKEITSSITNVSVNGLSNISVPTIPQRLMGRSPGIFIKNSGGEPGNDAININIRGFGPALFIVDGIPVSESYFYQLEPDDIENISILKDASAAAVYGARGGNGAIVVTTKRGTVSAPAISYSGSYGFQYFPIIPRQVNSAQYAAMHNVAMVYSEGLPARWTEGEIQKFKNGSDPINYPSTNWWKETIRSQAPLHQHNVNLKGGGAFARYFTSVNFFEQKGMHVANDVDHERLSFRANLDFQLDKRFLMGLDYSATNQKYVGPTEDFESSIMTRIFRSQPFARNEVHPDPSYLAAMLGGTTINPYQLGFIENVGSRKWDNFYSTVKARFEYELPYGIGAKAVYIQNNLTHHLNSKALEMRMYDYNPETDQYIVRRMLNQSEITKSGNNNDKNIYQQYYVTWDRLYDNHKLSAQLVYEASYNRFDYVNTTESSNKIDEAKGDGEEHRKGLIGRINYNYAEKYLLELNGRHEVASPIDNAGFFPSISAGWIISNEPFVRDHIPAISYFKLRASYGKSGFYSYPTAASSLSAIFETVHIRNYGMDFSLLNGTLGGSIDYFYRLRKDVFQKLYEFDDRGWELVINYSNKIGGIDYVLGGNLATTREKALLVEQNDFSNKESYRRGNKIGEWTDRHWSYRTDGIFKTQEEIDNWADIDGFGNRTIRPGDIRIVDYNGDGRITPEDMIIAGRGTMPKLMYGIDLTLRWKNFDFQALWQGAGLYNFNLAQGARNLIMPFYSENTPLLFMYENMYTPENPWMPANTNAKWPRWRMDSSNRNHSNFRRDLDFWLVDGFYIRLKNVNLGYSFSEKITGRRGMDVRVYFSGYNLLTFSKYNEFVDPENSTDVANIGIYHPPLANYSMGLQVKFK